MLRVLSLLVVAFCVLSLGCKPTENNPANDAKAEPANSAATAQSPDAEDPAEPGNSSENSQAFSSQRTTPTADSEHASNDWPKFRGDSVEGSDPAATVPIKWTADQGILWKTEVIEGVKSRGSSSPIIVGDRIFLTAFTGCGTLPENRDKIADLQHHVICLDKHTGKQIWIRTIQGSYANKRLSEHALSHGYASSTPIVEGDRLFTFFGISGVFAFDLDGNLIWQKDVGSKHFDFGSSASLNIFEDLLLVNASVESEALYALETSTGNARWKLDDVIQSWCAPIIGKTETGEPELIINHQNMVRGLDPRTGKELWRCAGIDDYTVATPIVVDGVCYLTGGQQHQSMAIKLGGRGDVTESHRIWQVRGGSNVSSPVFHDGGIYVIATNGIMRCLDAETGEDRFRLRMGVPKQILASPTILGDHMFIPTQYKGVVVLNLEDSKIVSRNALTDESPLQASIAESENRLFMRTDNFVYCIGEPDQMTQTMGRPTTNSRDDIIIPKPKHDVDPKTGRPKTFIRCLVETEKEILDFMLLPYESVITPEQTKASTEYILANHQPFIELRKQYLTLRWDHMTGQLDDQAFQTQLAELEDKTMQHNYKVRKFIKDMFSKAQMDQHLRENGIIPKKSK